jgi:hypothetical protein
VRVIDILISKPPRRILFADVRRVNINSQWQSVLPPRVGKKTMDKEHLYDPGNCGGADRGRIQLARVKCLSRRRDSILSLEAYWNWVHGFENCGTPPAGRLLSASGTVYDEPTLPCSGNFSFRLLSWFDLTDIRRVLI